MIMSILSLSNKIVRRSVRTSLFLVILFQMGCIGGVCLCNAAEVDCDQLLSNEELQQYDFDKERIKKMQISLAALGYNPEKIDGKMGEKTIAALQRFCDDFKTERTENFAGDLAATLFHYAAIAMEYPDGNEKAPGNNTPYDEETGVAPSPEASEDAPTDTERVQEERRDSAGVVYKLTEEDVEELTDAGIPEGLIEGLKDLQDIEYENYNLFKKALVVKDDSLILNYAEKFKTYKLTEQFFALLTDAGVSSDIINELQELQDKEYASKNALVSAVEIKIEEATGEDRALIVEKARKEHEYDTSKSISWSGGSCGCAPDTSTVVYGFYPFWMAGTEQVLDFSVLSRIGYFALSFNEKGVITDTFHWKKKKPHADFIDVAHRYRTKMDLVIYNRSCENWHSMTSHERLNTIDTLTTNIVNLATIKLTNYWINAMKPYISFGFSPTRTMADGITIDFAEINSKDQREMFAIVERIISESRKKLDEAGNDYRLNIMIPMVDLITNEGVYNVEHLKKIDDITHKKDLFLVVLEEPIEANMRQLRYVIERNCNSEEQKKILRKIVPVITLGSGETSGLESTLIYLEDNFGGFGFWPLPLREASGKDDGNGTANVIREFLDENEIVEPASGLCSWLCPKRWAFRIGLFAALLVFIVYALLSAWICELRAVSARYIWYVFGVALLTAAVFFLTFWCDPFWKNYQIYFVFVSLFIGIACIIGISIKKRREAKFP
jgi:hypothetical protein